eukprot:scaffold76892_cov24-Phaeocystis_antarctica.AAC.1
MDACWCIEATSAVRSFLLARWNSSRFEAASGIGAALTPRPWIHGCCSRASASGRRAGSSCRREVISSRAGSETPAHTSLSK